MTNLKTIEIQLFGAFRDFDETGKLTIDVRNHSSVEEIKFAILKSLKKIERPGVNVEELLKFSVLATEEELLKENELVDLELIKQLAILPPVCGG